MTMTCFVTRSFEMNNGLRFYRIYSLSFFVEKRKKKKREETTLNLERNIVLPCWTATIQARTSNSEKPKVRSKVESVNKERIGRVLVNQRLCGAEKFKVQRACASKIGVDVAAALVR